MSLPGLTLRTLIHRAAKWPLPGKALLGCALAGAVWVVGEGVYLSPSRERLQQAEAREAALQQQIAQKAAQSAGLEARHHQLLVMREKVDALLQQLPGESEMPGLLEDIARLALANGLLVESVTPLQEQPQPLYTEQSVQIGVAGAYHDLAMFVSALGGLARITTTHDVALRPDGKLLRLDLLAKVYWHGRQDSGRRKRSVQPLSFTYDSSGLRDPFLLHALQPDHTPGRPATAPDLSRPRGVLESLAVEQFEMVGTLSRGLHTFALLRAASQVHRLAVGDYLGLDHGRVTAIHDGYVELVELFPDEQGAWLERPRTLVLNVNS
ncbi:pilus assembly protein [Pseudomonas kairouanensis]|uniref:Pilus assembly protein n=1 Tax=Pseudomonas kairouanensis TaxID=2293832 RepID=A0A4Z0AUI4_9PSED|nr:pilus assembly protein PilP [Pseudomonas kairouanensis]TFY89839.1 pilus assembly protein [Pseudomonas kairouanensis]